MHVRDGGGEQHTGRERERERDKNRPIGMSQIEGNIEKERVGEVMREDVREG